MRVVLRAREMAGPKTLHCFWVKQSTLSRTRTEKAVFHHRPQGAFQPLPDRHRKAVFCTRKNTRRQVLAHDLLEQVLGGPSFEFERRWNRRRELQQLVVQQGRPHFKGMRHAHSVHLDQNIVRKVGLDVHIERLIQRIRRITAVVIRPKGRGRVKCRARRSKVVGIQIPLNVGVEQQMVKFIRIGFIGRHAKFLKRLFTLDRGKPATD